MSTKTPKLDVAPWLAVAALLLAAVGVGVGGVALARSDDPPGSTPMSGQAMSGMDHGAMEHMQPLATDGIADASSNQGGTPLKGVRRDGALEFTLDARPAWWTLYGDKRVAAWAYNGIVPGPVIRVRSGERVRIRFTNNLPEETTIHWHGIGVPNAMDGVPGVTQEPIKPGEEFTYEFVARPAGNPRGGGTFLYHSHVDEDRQMSAGLYGAFVIDPPGKQRKVAVDRTLMVSEMSADEQGRVRGAMQMEGMFPNFFTINGKSFPDTETIEVPAGERVRLRLVNAGQFAHPLHLHGTAFRVVARDGHPVAAPYERRDTVGLESGERVDIEFKLPKGKWILHCHIGHHLTNDGQGPGGLMTVIEAT